MHATAEASTDQPGVTAELCNWVHSLTLDDIPQDVKERAKYLILDALACGLNGAHVPWSEDAAKATLEFEEPGTHTLIGWDEVRALLSCSKTYVPAKQEQPYLTLYRKLDL